MPILETIQQITPASLLVIYVLLPLLLAVFYIVPSRFRVPVLVLGSVVYLVFVQPQWVFLMLLSVTLSYLVCIGLERGKLSLRMKKVFVTGAVLLNLGVFIFAGTIVQLKDVPMVIGSTIYPIMALHGVVSCYQGKISGQMNFWTFALECMFFPKLYAGPFTDFSEDTKRRVEHHTLRFPTLSYGFGRFLRGALKSKIIGGKLWEIHQNIKAFSPGEVSLLSSWVYVISFAFALYFILSGYLEMTVGIGHLFGISYPEGFYYPYQAENFFVFSRRFHTSWQRLLHHYIYTPLLSGSQKRFAVVVVTIVTNMTFGMWFGFTFNYAIWGAFIGLMLLLEQYIYPKSLKTLPTFVGRIYVVLITLLSFPILTEVSVGESLTLYRRLFSWSGQHLPLSNDPIMYIITSNWLVLLVAAFLAVKGAVFLGNGLRRISPRGAKLLKPVGDLILLVFVTAVLL